MKSFILSLLLVAASAANAQSTSGSYTNFIFQYQLPSEVIYQWPVAPSGQSQSPLPINPGGARFELWTWNNATTPVAKYKLESRYVASYVPMATVKITSEDPYDTIPRTRADRPFNVILTVEGLKLNDPTAPEAAKKVNLLRHVQAYGAGGTGVDLDRTQATLLSQTYLEDNATSTLTFSINSIPNPDRTKVRGEERFSVFSLEDNRIDESSGNSYTAAAAQLASQYIQVWPVADGVLTGITANQLIRYKMPTLTITAHDLYPGSSTYIHAYTGAPQLGKTGVILPWNFNNTETTPQDRLDTLSDYDTYFPTDGQWTIELVTKTPFGIDRLSYVTFSLDRTIQMNGSVTTITD